MIRLAVSIALTTSLVLSAAAVAATSQEKKETCEFGANDKKLSGAARKTFMTKCMADRDSPRGKPVAAPKQ